MLSHIQSVLLKANFRKSFKITSGIQTIPLGRYHKMTTQQPAPTADLLQLNPVAISAQPSNSTSRPAPILPSSRHLYHPSLLEITQNFKATSIPPPRTELTGISIVQIMSKHSA